MTTMRLSTHDLPMFFADSHGALAERLAAAAPAIAAIEDAPDEATRDRAAAQALAAAGLFELVVPHGAIRPGAPSTDVESSASDVRSDLRVDTRALCLAREMLGYTSARADSIFAVQGLGTHSIVLAGTDEQRAGLRAFARGAGIAAFAITEPDAGSDISAIWYAAPGDPSWRRDHAPRRR
jgi:acyl-CoA dehydrogenase